MQDIRIECRWEHRELGQKNEESEQKEWNPCKSRKPARTGHHSRSEYYEIRTMGHTDDTYGLLVRRVQLFEMLLHSLHVFRTFPKNPQFFSFSIAENHAKIKLK
ncbi:hypothetical protein [Bacillus sp. 165]|uniref:hypothetical protein n=1 Tax=Bacillus sp. 165 TaxID=1529117 RepID=UPI001ADB06BB|nr:hypothetical protein [Bacillus sp. 165]MBO9130073.1 hypothetical protein [Bacillus sp. 165]